MTSLDFLEGAHVEVFSGHVAGFWVCGRAVKGEEKGMRWRSDVVHASEGWSFLKRKISRKGNKGKKKILGTFQKRKYSWETFLKRKYSGDFLYFQIRNFFPWNRGGFISRHLPKKEILLPKGKIESMNSCSTFRKGNVFLFSIVGFFFSFFSQLEILVCTFLRLYFFHTFVPFSPSFYVCTF